MSSVARAAFAQSVVRGLGDMPRWLSCRYLYDAEGSRLFDDITRQPEYYLTRAEAALLVAHAHEIRSLAGPSTLVELGAGTATKTRHLLRAWPAGGATARYVPVDICGDVLETAALELEREFPRLAVEPLCATYEQAFARLGAFSPTTLCFLGSSIGNLNPPEQDELFTAVAGALEAGDHLLLGIDLVKDARTLEAAYNDRAGVTERFTRNLLVRMNRDLGTTIDLDSVEHVAWYNAAQTRIEIYARFTRGATITLADHARTFEIRPGELVMTEISTKFHAPDVAMLAARRGLDLVRTFATEDAAFALLLFRRRSRPAPPHPRVVASRLLADARARTLELIAPLGEAALTRQWSPLMSPIVWDLGHIANFEEQWVRRAHRPERRRDDAARQRDHCYDAVAHARSTRGDLPLLGRTGALSYLSGVRAETLAAIDAATFAPGDPLLHGGFVHAMLAQHEAQHTETILQTIQIAQIGYEPARREGPLAARVQVSEAWQTYVPEGPFMMGTDDRTLAYDNERPAHEVHLPAFRIDVAPVTNGTYLRFVEDGGYARRSLWTDEGWAWLQRARVAHPAGWDRSPDGGWTERAFGRVEPLLRDQPVVHVCWHEANAYARWAGRRLPTEAEWEKAAAWDLESLVARRYPWGDTPPTHEHANLGQTCFAPAAIGAYPRGVSYFGCHQMLGCVWEWTSSDFAPYPGFEVFPYPEYSATHFGRGYKVLRGGSWATQALVARNTFRNWDLPERRQIFAGFRCASDC
ncbi:MAG TPA: ergothioneine biosynthesis protein EgtB [Candidatus Eisenbacteria bacterium]|nr:ergothioneine biosynthesis protein EgtB [Candidatus Eisenbacteria bacterium]